MTILFEVRTKDNKLIRLTLKQWKHVAYRHPEMPNMITTLEFCLVNPDFIKEKKDIKKYYKYLKNERKYIMVAVKLLNGEGFIMTSYLTKRV